MHTSKTYNCAFKCVLILGSDIFETNIFIVGPNLAKIKLYNYDNVVYYFSARCSQVTS